MKNLKVIAFALLCFCVGTTAYSQGDFYFHFGPSVPVSDFASDDMDDDDAGGAAVGLNVGLQYIYPISENGLGIFGGIDVNYNGLKKDVKDDVEEIYDDMGLNDYDIKYYKYINVPITAGFNYSHQADEKIGVFANAGLALNFSKITPMEVKSGGETVTTEMDLANSIGFKIGAGISINQKTTLSIDYLGLGSLDYDGKVKATGFSQDIDGEGKVDIVTVTLGFKF